MRNIAIIPWGKIWLKDELFNLNNKVLNRDDCLLVWQKMREYLNSNSIAIHTIDMYSDLRTVDLFVFFYFDRKWFKEIRGIKNSKTVYVAFEPPVVDSNNSEKGLKFLMNYFDYIITWNDDLIDGKHFFKFMYPYVFRRDKSRFDLSLEEFNKKKLLCNISSNKTSFGKNELYSERRKVIEYYDKREDFCLFGMGWDSANKKYSSYKGIIDNKFDIYSGFKYALCLENMKCIKGYITEKILDCFCAGVIPVYVGASNCDRYIPDNCYIHYDDFNSLEQLDNYILNLAYEEYVDVLQNIKNYLESDGTKVFLPEKLGDTLIYLLQLGCNCKHGNLISYYIYKVFSKLNVC